jgi:tetratricopeptide (TPR) repeat protein
MLIANVSDGLRASTAKSWMDAVDFWTNAAESNSYVFCDFFLAEAAFSIGDFELARTAFARVAASHQQLPSVAAFAKVVRAEREVSHYESAQSGITFSKLLESELAAGTAEREFGRRLLSEGQFARALEYWTAVDLDGHPERELRLANAHYKLGQYAEALAQIARLAAAGRYAEKIAPLKDKCIKGAERAKRAYSRGPDALGHPFIRDVREFLTHNDSIGLSHLAVIATDWCGGIGAWDSLIVLLRRGMLAGDKTILKDIPKTYAGDLALFAKSRAMRAVSLAQFRDYVGETLIAGSFFEAAELLVGQPQVAAGEW